MKTINFTLIICALLFSQTLLGQFDYQIVADWDFKRKPGVNDKIKKVILASNGYIIAVGETRGDRYDDTDGLFLVVGAEDGIVKKRKQFKGTRNDGFNSVVQHPDGTFTIVGYTESGSRGGKDGWVVKVDINGLKDFESRPASQGRIDDEIMDVAINSDGTVWAVGMQTTKKSQNPWLLKIDGENIEQEVLGNGELEEVVKITADEEDNFIILGNTSAKNRQHPYDAWVMKMDKEGNQLWGGAQYIGDKGVQEGLDITSTSDGGYAIVGATNSSGAGAADMWLCKVNKRGKMTWQQAYGQPAEDVATAVLELSDGSFAIFGHSWSHMRSAKYAAMQLIIADKKGKELTSDFNPVAIYERGHDEIAHSMVESYNGENIILAGNKVSVDDERFTIPGISSVLYKVYSGDLKRPKDKDSYGSNLTSAISLSPATFFDENSDQSLHRNERGYLAMEITNNGTSNLSNISGKVSANGTRGDLDYWKDIKVGTLRAGQTKKIFVPVQAKKVLTSDAYEFKINVDVDGVYAASSNASLGSNLATPQSPAKLMADGSFSPKFNPQPGRPIILSVELTNKGGQATGPFEAYFKTPPGIRSADSERLRIPNLRSGERRKLTFSFTYDRNFRDRMINIEFETKGQEVPSVYKTFRMQVEEPTVAHNPTTNRRPSTSQATGGKDKVELLWRSHNLNQYKSRTVDVNTNKVDVGVIALSKKRLAKNNFGILIDGKRAQGQKMDEARLTPPSNDAGRNEQWYNNKVKLREGKNRVQIVYRDEAGIEHKSPYLIFDYTPKDKPNLFVVSIGVKHKDLKYTTKDAKDFAGTYQKLNDHKGRGFKKVKVFELTAEEHTTKNNIQKLFFDIEKWGIKDGDLLVIFLSSHGKINRFNEYILMPSDYDPQYEDVLSINFKNDILKRLRTVDGNKLVFIDACHSGGAFNGGRTFSDAAASKVMNDLIKATSGMEILASCSDHEYSYEDDKWGNGAFTKSIIEAFNNQMVEVDGQMISADIYNELGDVRKSGSDGVITIEELRQFVQKRVPHLVKSVKNKPQHPSHKSTDLLPANTGIYMVNKRSRR